MAESLAPIDESVKIPDRVKAQAAQAEAFYTQTPPTPTTEQTPEPPAAAEAAPAPTPVETPAPTPPPDYTAEIERLRAENAKRERDYNALLGRNAQQRDYIAMQQNQLAQLSNPRSWAQQPQPQKRQLITDEERKAYGDEALSVMERKAREVVQPVVDQITRQNQALQQELQQVKANDVYQVLNVHLPNWREINRDEDWKAWLRLPDLYSGVVRQQLLDEAFAAGDAGRILAFFRGYQAESPGHMDPPSQALQGVEPPVATPPVRKATMKLEDLAAPGRASPSPPASAIETKPVITNKDVSRFYWQITHGHWNGREQEKAAREAEIHAAVREGRVQMVR